MALVSRKKIMTLKFLNTFWTFCFLKCHSFIPKWLIGVINPRFILLILSAECPLTNPLSSKNFELRKAFLFWNYLEIWNKILKELMLYFNLNPWGKKLKSWDIIKSADQNGGWKYLDISSERPNLKRWLCEMVSV